MVVVMGLRLVHLAVPVALIAVHGRGRVHGVRCVLVRVVHPVVRGLPWLLRLRLAGVLLRRRRVVRCGACKRIRMCLDERHKKSSFKHSLLADCCLGGRVKEGFLKRPSDCR